MKLPVDQKEIEIATKYPNLCRLSEEDNVLEIFADNHTLSNLRSCEGFFKESFINNLEQSHIKSNGEETIDPSRTNLDIGIWFHTVMEHVDSALVKQSQLSTSEIILYAQELWLTMKLDLYQDTKAYEAIGGSIGALQLVKDYMDFFNPTNLTGFTKIIASELVFGYNKEAPLNHWTDESQNEGSYRYRGYLVGRPDGIVETPIGIGPKDFKTTSRMDAVRATYKPSEQLTGYVYGVNKIFQNSLEHLGKSCNTAYLIAVSKKATKNPKDRVAQITYTYSDQDLEAYRKRQIATLDRLYELLVLDAQETWDTSKCANWYYNQCPFHTLHSSDCSQREAMVKSYYKIKKPWNPLTR